uniref:SAM domain-containing protein n=1 Tax=Panagrellus redivivus TaxID=6233 RepID=A0A7E4WCV8_PANRE
MASPHVLWTKFFKSCNLPSPLCSKYADNFIKQRIQPAMLKDIGKTELRDLGVTAVGDQLAILKHIKEHHGVPPELSEEVRGRGASSSSALTASEARRGRPPPDRNEVYRVTMPEGRTPRTRGILQQHAELRSKGLIARGTSGVRVGGRTLDRVSEESRVIRKVVPTTSRLRSDQLDERRPNSAGRNVRFNVVQPPRPINPKADRFAAAAGIQVRRVPARGGLARSPPPPPVRVVRRVVSEPEYYDDEDEVMEEDYDPNPRRVIRRVRYA